MKTDKFKDSTDGDISILIFLVANLTKVSESPSASEPNITRTGSCTLKFFK